MSGVREVIETWHVPLDPTKNFHLALPERFLQDESRRDRLEDIWNNDVVPAINRFCRVRKSGLINRTLKRSVFASNMDNVCHDFSRRPENFTVQFQCTEESRQNHPNRKVITYSLIFTRLTPVVNNLRQARYCVAEIPDNPHMQPTAEAERVEPTEDSSTLPTAHSEIVATSVPIERGCEPYWNPPVACEVTAIVEDEDVQQHPLPNNGIHDNRDVAMITGSDCDTRKSALERMEELESIKSYLTQEEYTNKRQAILNSI